MGNPTSQKAEMMYGGARHKFIYKARQIFEGRLTAYLKRRGFTDEVIQYIVASSYNIFMVLTEDDLRPPAKDLSEMEWIASEVCDAVAGRLRDFCESHRQAPPDDSPPVEPVIPGHN